MSDTLRSILRNTGSIGGVRLSNSVATLVLSLVLARVVGAEGLGLYSTALAFYGILSQLCVVGLRDLMARQIARNPEDTGRYVVHGILGTTFLASLVGGIGALVAPLLPWSLETGQTVRWITWAIPAGAGLIVVEAAFVARERAEVVFGIEAAGVGARLLLGVAALLLGFGVQGLILVFVVVNYATLLVLLGSAFRRFGVPSRFVDPRFARDMLRGLRTLATLGTLSALTSEIEILLLSFLTTPEVVGIYSAAAKLVRTWHFVPDSAMTAVFPLLARSHVQEPERFKRLARGSLGFLLLTSAAIASVLLLAAEPLIEWLYGPQFQSSVPILRWLAPVLVPMFVHELLWRLLISRDREHQALVCLGIRLLVTTTLSFLLMPQYGAFGCVIAFGSGVIATTLGEAIYSVRRPLR